MITLFATHVGPMLTLIFAPVSVKMTHIISVLNAQVKIGSPSSHALTLSACSLVIAVRSRAQNAAETHHKVVSQVRHGDSANRHKRNLALECGRDSAILGCGYDKVYRLVRLCVSPYPCELALDHAR